MMTFVLAVGTFARWMSTIALLVTILAAVTGGVRAIWQVGKAIDRQLDATKENTAAIKDLAGGVHDLTGRVTGLEAHMTPNGGKSPLTARFQREGA